MSVAIAPRPHPFGVRTGLVPIEIMPDVCAICRAKAGPYARRRTQCKSMFFHVRCLQEQARNQPNATRPIICPTCGIYCYVGAADRWELTRDHFYDGEIDANHVVVNGRVQPRPPELDWNTIVRHPHLEEALRQRDWDDVGRGLINVPPPLDLSFFERAFDRIYHDRRIRDLMRRGNWQEALAYLMQHYRATLDYETLMPIVVYDVLWWIGLVSCVYWCICIVY